MTDRPPKRTPGWGDRITRRSFLQWSGISLASAAWTSCMRQPDETIVPYAEQPEQLVPGRPLFFATSMPHDGGVIGLLVESHEGRPTKVEGNPSHPGSLGATDAFAQASVRTLYDPDRAQVVRRGSTPLTWDDFRAALAGPLERHRSRHGRGLYLLTPPITSPTLGSQLRGLLRALPEARWHQYDPVAPDNALEGARLAFGRPLAMRYDFTRARVVLSLDGDFFSEGPGRLRYARDFSARRFPRASLGDANRLYAVHSTPNLTSAAADHALPARAGDVVGIATRFARRLGVLGEPAPAGGAPDPWIEAAARDLDRQVGSALVVAGRHQPAVVHALAHLLNQRLGAFSGGVVAAIPPVVEGAEPCLPSLAALVQAMDARAVETLIVLGGNPVYDAPADFEFGRRLESVPLRIHHSLFANETSARCHWHLPEAHFLEAWSDGRAYDGTASIQQPLIAPLYSGRSAHEVLLLLAEAAATTGHDLVRAQWRDPLAGGSGPDAAWNAALRAGVIPKTAFHPVDAPARLGHPLRAALDATPAAAGLELNFRPDPTLWDGRFAENPWLQELPKPFTTITWGNAALIAPADAARTGVQTGDVLELRFRGRRGRLPAFVLPSHPAGAVTLHLGHGRVRGGKHATGGGLDAYALRSAEAPWFGDGLEIAATGTRAALAATQNHHSMEGRDLVRTATASQAARSVATKGEDAADPGRPGLYAPPPSTGHAWGMVIDLTACIGCGACVVACQAENNIPSVGKEEVLRGHEMHWIRIDEYHVREGRDAKIHHQPVPCMHCEEAPCELVCPVGATVHSSEGLNEMIYNRCVGTRYCSNNCPYKVRRFNFFEYTDPAPSLKLQRNPDVTVRSRGVMEKCTYCVQRIREAEISAREAGRPVRDGDVVTACQAVCPTEAIVFGDLLDASSRVSRARAHPLQYGLLTELNTHPRTRYLARVFNPNPAEGPSG